MDYQSFFTKYGGSYRTNHLKMTLPQRLRRRLAGPAAAGLATNGDGAARSDRIKGDPGAALGRAVQRRMTAASRAAGPRLMTVAGNSAPVDSPGLLAATSGRPYRLPPPSALPPEYIRLDPWEGEYLFALAGHAKGGIVETGRFHGGSTFLMSCANEQVPIWSIDIEPQGDAVLQGYFAEHGVGGNADLIVGDSQQTKYDQIGQFDMLFVDGDHSYDGCMADLTNWYPDLSPGGHVVLHDSYLHSEVQAATIDFIESHDVTVVRSPFIHAVHWHHPTGSLAHFIKRS